MWKPSNISTWLEYFQKNSDRLLKHQHAKISKLDPISSDFKPSDDISCKISLFKGSITELEIDAVVNAANQWLRGGGGVDGAIHAAAGRSKLMSETERLYPDGCDPGRAVITKGFKLPAKNIIHTVGPTDGDEDTLMSCYLECLKLCVQRKLRTVAFCCIATGIYGFPNDKAAQIALATTRAVLEEFGENFDRVIFCVFLDIDERFYEKYLTLYFPVSNLPDEENKDGKIGSNEGATNKSPGEFYTLAKKRLEAERERWTSVELDNINGGRNSPQGEEAADLQPTSDKGPATPPSSLGERMEVEGRLSPLGESQASVDIEVETRQDPVGQSQPLTQEPMRIQEAKREPVENQEVLPEGERPVTIGQEDPVEVNRVAEPEVNQSEGKRVKRDDEA